MIMITKTGPILDGLYHRVKGHNLGDVRAERA
jgi:hypothetical protein